MKSYPNYIDLFAGAGGLSEGFARAGFHPVAHVEMDEDACKSIKTRLVYHFIMESGKSDIYEAYLRNEISREVLWCQAPDSLLNSVINIEISDNTLDYIFSKIDNLVNKKKVDLIIGGPPCQAYSLVGRSRDPYGMEGDKRNYLFRYYAEFLQYYQPKYFVFENVLGLLSAGKKRYLIEMVQLFESVGYSVAEPVILNAQEYGVLQKRRRVIIAGRKGGRQFNFPELDKMLNQWQIQKDLFYDLPALKPGEKIHVSKYIKPVNEYLKTTGIRNGFDFVTQHISRPHNQRDLEIYFMAIDKWINDKIRLKYTDLPAYLQTHKNKSAFLDRFKVVDPNGHSHTLVAHISKDGHYYIHPDIKQIRSISVREAARIQSFPDDYYFEGRRTSVFRQIGNAVPPLMSFAIAKKFFELIHQD